MQPSSFRDILARFLEEKEPDSPRQTPVQDPAPRVHSTPDPLWNWQNPHPAKTRGPRAYPQAAKTTPRPATPSPKPAPPEVLIPVRCLLAADRERLATVAALGAPELNDGISLARLKRAHRRLAKRLHPDAPEGDGTRFRILQEAYEGLERALKKLNAPTDDNGSAWAAASPRRAAA